MKFLAIIVFTFDVLRIAEGELLQENKFEI